MASMVSPHITRSPFPYLGRRAAALLLGAAALLPATCLAQTAPYPRPTTSAPPPMPSRAQMGMAPLSDAQRSISPNVADAVSQWRRFQQSDAQSYYELSGFLMRNPGWPGEDRLRRLAEASMPLDSYAAAQNLSFFQRLAPLTTSGRVRHALALNAAGQREAANVAARDAWTAGMLTPDEEQRLIATFPGVFTAADHDARMDALLWAGRTGDAQRQLAWTSASLRPVFGARLAMRARYPDAAMRAAEADALGRNDPGYLADKANWLRATGQSLAARQTLAAPHALSRRPADIEAWYDTLLVHARGAANDRQWSSAYAIASQIDAALPPGGDVRSQSAGVRDVYTDLAWLAGTTAFYELNRPADAIQMFRRYGDAPSNPALKAKGYYWAGRAAERAAQPDAARTYFAQAAEFGDSFYGQLSAERAGQPVPVPRPGTLAVSQAERNGFFDSRIVQATRMLGQTGARTDQTLFLRAIANNAKTPADHALAAELSSQIGRPDLGVMIGRSARINRLPEILPAYYPQVTVPGSQSSNWTMIHAITRQESQFDRTATSRVGARGLMQLMPGTANEVAGKLGLGYDAGRLHSDPSYNLTLGSSYFQQMLRYYNGSYPLALAAYNGGPGNVNKWLREFGDPRGSGDILRWIERIPLSETKYYVQYVLSNAVMYENIRAAQGGQPRTNLLSFYLGKRTPG